MKIAIRIYIFIIISFFSILQFLYAASDKEIQEIVRLLPRLAEDKIFFHWTSPNTGIRWILQGSIDEGEMRFLNTPSNNNKQVYGAGLYLAADDKSSRRFGSMPVVFKIKKGTLLYDNEVIKKVLNKELSEQEKSNLGTEIPFVRKVSNKDDWWVTNHPDNVKEIEFGEKYGAKMGEQIGYFSQFMEFIRDAVRDNPEGRYMESLIHLSDYMDGISFIRAITVNPGNPWNEFEPDRFERFKESRHEFFSQSASIKKGHGEGLGIITSAGRFTSAKDPDLWPIKQVEEILPMLHKSITGNGDSEYRNEGVRGGGSDDGNRFYVTKQELTELQSNPYLTVEVQYDQKEQAYLVSYHYPDVFHFKKLKDFMSEELFDELNKVTEKELWDDADKRKMLNQKLVKELLLGVFKKYHAMGIGEGNGLLFAKFLRDLVSIHPFSDFNGRTLRFYMDLAVMNTVSSEAKGYYLSDFDLLKSPEFFAKSIKKEADLKRRMRLDFIRELLMARSDKRRPDFLNLPIVKEKMEEQLKLIGGENFSSKNLDWDLVKERKFLQFFDSLFGKNWRERDLFSQINIIGGLESTEKINQFVGFLDENSGWRLIDDSDAQSLFSLFNKNQEGTESFIKRLLKEANLSNDTISNAIMKFSWLKEPSSQSFIVELFKGDSLQVRKATRLYGSNNTFKLDPQILKNISQSFKEHSSSITDESHWIGDFIEIFNEYKYIDKNILDSIPYVLDKAEQFEYEIGDYLLNIYDIVSDIERLAIGDLVADLLMKMEKKLTSNYREFLENISSKQGIAGKKLQQYYLFKLKQHTSEATHNLIKQAFINISEKNIYPEIKDELVLYLEKTPSLSKKIAWLEFLVSAKISDNRILQEIKNQLPELKDKSSKVKVANLLTQLSEVSSANGAIKLLEEMKKDPDVGSDVTNFLSNRCLKRVLDVVL